MKETVSCPQCRRELELPPEALGHPVQCPQCSTVFTASTGRAEPPVSAAAEAIEADLPAAIPEIEPMDDAPAEEPPRVDRPRARRSRIPKRATAMPRTASRYGAVAVLAGILVLGTCVIGLIWRANRPIAPGFLPPGNAIKAPDPLGPIVGVAEPPLLANGDPPKVQMNEFFRRFTAMMRASNQAGIADCFDVSDMVTDLAARNQLPDNTDRARVGMDFQRGLAIGLMKNNQLTQGDVRHVRKVKDGELIVITRHMPEGGLPGRQRWWLTARNGTWKITDMENLETGLRVSVLMGPLIADRLGRGQHADILALRDAQEALILRQDFEGTEKLLKGVRIANLPNQVAGAYHQIYAIVHMRQTRYEACLASCNDAVRARADLPIVELLRAVSYNELKKYDKAVVHARACIEQMGDDPDLFQELGLALSGLGKWKEAAVEYRKTLDEEPKNAVAFLSLLRTMGQDVDAGDVGVRFARLDRPQDHFVAYAQELWQRREMQSLEQLGGAMRKLDPRSAAAEFYLALAHAQQRRFDAALAAFNAAVDLENVADQKRHYYREFTKVLAYQGHAVAAYPKLPDALLAFESLSTALREIRRLDEVRELTRLHVAKHPDDPVVQFHRADELVLDGKYAEGEKLFVAAFAQRDNAELRATYRANRVLARYHLGDALGAYRDLPPRTQTFDQLAALCWFDKKKEDLKALVDAHAKADEEDPHLFRAQWRVRILFGKFSAAGAFAKAALKEGNKAESRDPVADFVFDMLDSGHVVEAYRHAPDRSHALELISGEVADPKVMSDILAEHRKAFPDDPMADIVTGTTAEIAREWVKAADAFRAGWAKLPNAKRGRWLYSYLRVSYKAGRAFEVFAEVAKDHPDAFRNLAGIIIQDKNRVAFEKLVEIRRPTRADHPDFDAYDARLKVLDRKVDEAAKLIQQAYAKAPEFERRMMLDGFVGDLAALDFGLDAYRCTPDKQAAFQVLIWRVRDKKKIADFQTLLDEHAKHHPEDRQLLFERAELYLLKDDAAKAEEQFLLAKQKNTPGDDVRVRLGLMRARIRLGKAVETYRESGANATAFAEVAGQCTFEKNAEQLQAVVAAHRKNFPGATELPAWDVEVLWLKKDYTATAKAIQDRRGDLLGKSKFRWKVEGYLIRSLVRAKQFKDAVTEAEAMNKGKDGPRTLLVLALAASGDVQGAIASVEKHNPHRFFAEDCYRDEDLGPIVRGAAFAEFRKRFPEPPAN